MARDVVQLSGECTHPVARWSSHYGNPIGFGTR